jgi:hypothetical protein
MTTRLPRRAALALSGLLAATLACTNAMAASFEGSVVLGKLNFAVSGDGNYSLSPSASSILGSLAAVNIDNTENPTNNATVGFATSSPLSYGEFGSPFDTTQAPITATAHGQSATIEIAQNLIRATVSTDAQSGYFGYAEGNIGALNLGNGAPGGVQSTLLIDAHTKVTISASAYIGLNALDAAACTNCDGQFTAYAALVGNDQFAAYLAANRGEGSLRQSALTNAGIAFIGIEQARLTDANSQASSDNILTLTFSNDTDSVQGYGFFANAWINGSSLPSSTTAVPEGGTWAMALVGLLVSGIAMRRRQRV